jgi:hypothetical protein
MRTYLIPDKPTIISQPNNPTQIFIQNQGPHRIQIRPHYPQSMRDSIIDDVDDGTFLCSGDILILAFASPIIPVVRVIARADDEDCVVDVQEWPY